MWPPQRADHDRAEVQPKGGAQRQDWFDLTLVLLFGVGCFSIHLWRGFTVDEYTTWSVTRLPLSELIQNRLKNGHVPAYFVLVQAWSRLAGEAEFVLRIPSVVLALMGLGATWLLMRDLSGRRGALIAGALYPVHQVIIWSSQNARPWAGVLGFSILAALGLIRFWKTQRAGWLAVVAVSVAAGFSFAAAFALTIGALVLAMLLSARQAPRLAGWSLVALLAPLTLLSVPALILAETQEKYSGDRGPFRFNLFRGINGLGDVILGDYKIWTGEWVRYLALMALISLGWCAWRALSGRQSPAERLPARAIVFSWLLVPWVCLVLGAAITRTSMLSHERYFVPLVGAIIIVLATGLAHITTTLPGRARRWLPACAVWLLMAVTAVSYWRSDGDGPRLVVREWQRTGLPRTVVGHIGPLNYEFRAGNGPRRIAAYGYSTDKVRDMLIHEANTGPVWLFVYNNKTTPLDVLLRESVEGLIRTRTVEHRDARAALFERAASHPE